MYLGDSYREFGEVTAVDARTQAAELAAAGSWGPLARVAGVAQAWRELAIELERVGEGSTVAALDEATRTRYARRLWVEPPGGSLL
ncbi:MAG: hypothetical protein BGO11_02565 [Solirubrobacterales bacterium 70-9]|nr:MAG: hypothetical protein BGO11_02565 [Solirubrobacterales bacterium 70-9]